jgi:hypothetical protein
MRAGSIAARKNGSCEIPLAGASRSAAAQSRPVQWLAGWIAASAKKNGAANTANPFPEMRRRRSDTPRERTRRRKESQLPVCLERNRAQLHVLDPRFPSPKAHEGLCTVIRPQGWQLAPEGLSSSSLVTWEQTWSYPHISFPHHVRRSAPPAALERLTPAIRRSKAIGFRRSHEASWVSVILDWEKGKSRAGRKRA